MRLLTSAAWTAYWSPILRALTTQCLNPCREIRQQAFASLERTLLSPSLASAEHTEWTAIFSDVLFPLVTQLLKPEIYQSDPVGMSETRVRAATLLCKVYLHYLNLLAEWDGLLDLWLRIISVLDRLMNSGQGDNLVRVSRLFCHYEVVLVIPFDLPAPRDFSRKYDPWIGWLTRSQEEAVSENLKNILLVMSNAGFLTPPSNSASSSSSTPPRDAPSEGEQHPSSRQQRQEQLWTETWKRINRFLPSFFAELFPDEARKAKGAGATSAPAPSAAGSGGAGSSPAAAATASEALGDKGGEGAVDSEKDAFQDQDEGD